MPVLSNATPQFKAVWPPKDRRMASGCSRAITLATKAGVTGRKYTRSATPSEVWMVAMFGLMSTVEMPSSLRALSAWVPE